MYISHRARGTHAYARIVTIKVRKMDAIKRKLHHKENDSIMHSYLPNDSRIWTYDIKHRTEYWNIDHLNKRKFLCQSWIWTSWWGIAPFFYVFHTLDLLLFVGVMILQQMMQNFEEGKLSRANEDLTCYACCIWKKKKNKRYEKWNTIHWLISSIMWRGKVSQDWQP